MELEEIKKERKKINEEIRELRNKQYLIDGEYLKLVQEKCKENIGRCFKKLKEEKVVSYCKIINIDKPVPKMYGQPLFNEYQYPTLWFEYPYNNSKMPFYKKNIFSGAWGNGNDIISKLEKISYVEISKEEFFEEFNKINQEWIKRLNKL